MPIGVLEAADTNPCILSMILAVATRKHLQHRPSEHLAMLRLAWHLGEHSHESNLPYRLAWHLGEHGSEISMPSAEYLLSGDGLQC